MKLSFLINSLLASHAPKTADPTLLEVCLSPGCVADGAEETLKKCMAFAPSDLITIQKGGCVSACGNGPVLRVNERIIHKRVSDVNSLLEKILEGGEDIISKNILEGYKVVSDAQDLVKEKKLVEAVYMYENGISIALDSAISFSKRNGNEKDDGKTPQNLVWIVQAYCDLAEVKRQLKEYDSAIDAVNKACELSKNKDSSCWDLMATICQECNYLEKEMNALKILFALDADVGSELPRDVANRRRTQGFRLAKLERELPTK